MTPLVQLGFNLILPQLILLAIFLLPVVVVVAVNMVAVVALVVC